MKSAAAICRENGWVRGTILEGDEGYGPERIQLTAIGIQGVLARRIMNHKGEAIEGYEGSWSLDHRDWKAI